MENLTEGEEELRRARAHMDGLYKAIFEDDKRGEAILMDLQARFVRDPSPSDFSEEGMLKAFVQAHQRRIFEYIVKRINAANDVPELQPQGPDDE